jgi:hypothetical protein
MDRNELPDRMSQLISLWSAYTGRCCPAIPFEVESVDNNHLPFIVGLFPQISLRTDIGEAQGIRGRLQCKTAAYSDYTRGNVTPPCARKGEQQALNCPVNK